MLPDGCMSNTHLSFNSTCCWICNCCLKVNQVWWKKWRKFSHWKMSPNLSLNPHVPYKTIQLANEGTTTRRSSCDQHPSWTSSTNTHATAWRHCTTGRGHMVSSLLLYSFASKYILICLVSWLACSTQVPLCSTCFCPQISFLFSF